MKFLPLLLVFASVSAFAADKKTEDKSVPQAKFVTDIQTSLPKLFCGEQAYFRKCFSSTETECAASAKTAVEECVKLVKDKLPASFNQPADGQKWGQEIGTCAGEKFELALAAKKTDSADCKDQAKWK